MTFTPTIASAPITRPTTRRVVRFAEDRSMGTVAAIQRMVADEFGVPVASMVGRGRKPEECRPRMIAMFLVRELTGLSLDAIGRAFGGRDHGTVFHACRAVRDWETVESGLAPLIDQLRQRCGKGL